MKFKEKRMTKAMIKAARQKRAAMFEGMTNKEIEEYKPINTAYLYEYQNSHNAKWGMVIAECVICGETHRHGNGGEGFYSAHCIKVDNEEVFPFQYEVVIDMSDEDNQRLCEKYGVK